MRGLMAHLLVDLAVAAVIVAVVSPVGAGLAGPSAASAGADGGIVQLVDRTNKGDRMNSVAKPTQRTRARPMHGCEAVYSPLAVSPSANYSGRCIT